MPTQRNTQNGPRLDEATSSGLQLHTTVVNARRPTLSAARSSPGSKTGSPGARRENERALKQMPRMSPESTARQALK
eukprot:1600353-Alexandrium_andersonii.AAC.1